jgi:DNA mismatch repair protein MutS
VPGVLTRTPSILFEMSEDRGEEGARMPAFFPDLNLDQVVAAITSTKEEYDLKPFFFRPLRRVAAVEYRHDVFRELENSALRECADAFAEAMRNVRGHLTQSAKLYYKYQKEAWFCIAVDAYCEAIAAFERNLAGLDLRSRGWTDLRDYVREYASSRDFVSLRAEVKEVAAELSALQYCILIRDGGFTVRKYEGEPDYSAMVEATFEKFKQSAVKDYRVQFSEPVEMNHIEEKVLEFVSRLYPEPFAHLDDFCERNRDFIDEAIRVFDRELQFYVAYLDFVAQFERLGLHVCYPEITTDGDKEIYDHDGYDLALAAKLAAQQQAVVSNDFELHGKERIIVVSGPNQGGKTTFARAFGQLHYMAALGCPVPGTRARLFLFDDLYVQFEKEESIENLRGKLEDDLVRLRTILDRATADSIVILNEIFTSTTIADAMFLSHQIMRRLVEKDLLAVWVTFIDELSRFSEQTVSMTSMVVPENPAVRTFKVVRRPADGLAYALAIAEKHRVTYAALKDRIRE